MENQSNFSESGTYPTDVSASSANPVSNHPVPSYPQPQVAQVSSKSNLNILVICLVFLGIALVGFGGYYFGTLSTLKPSVADQGRSANLTGAQPSAQLESSTSSDLTADGTSDWQVFTGNGFTMKHPSNWLSIKNPGSLENDLKGECQTIRISSSDAIQRELSLAEYVMQVANLNSTQAAQALMVANEKDTNLSVKFDNISARDIAILGVENMGDGAWNVVVIRGPEGKGYYKIEVLNSVDKNEKPVKCSGEKAEEYKKILQTFRFNSEILILEGGSTGSKPSNEMVRYGSSEAGIYFTLPKGWVQLGSGDGGLSFSLKPASNLNLRVDRGKFILDQPLSPLSNAFSIKIGQNPGGNKNNIKLEDLNVDGYPAVLISMDSLDSVQEPPGFQYVYAVKRNSDLYSFTFWQQGTDSKANLIKSKFLFDSILSTAKLE